MVGINIAILFFLLTLQTEIVVAVDGDFNTACISGTSCTSPDHVCDPVGTICRKKSGIACSTSDSPVGCVTDATCTSSLCTCPSTTHIASGGLCKLKVDGTCSSSSAKCVTNAACPSGGGTCACNTGYVPSSDKTACLLKVGQTSCTADAPCTANSVCSSGTCTCSGNYLTQASGACLLKAAQTCAVDADCTLNSVCPTSGTKICTCSANFVAQTSGVCLLKADQTGCNGDNPCTANSACSSGTCTCSTNYVSHASGLCVLKAGQTGCTADAQCTANSYCSTGTTRTCTCSTNYVAQTTSGLCAPKENTYGGSCTIASSVDSCVTPGLDANALCSGGTCGCKTGYTATVGAKCLLKSGQTCTADSDCTANSACPTGTSRTCTCSTNYVAQTNGVCAPKENTYGGSCTIVSSVDSCVTTGADANAVCSAAIGGSCGCKSGYTATVGAKCSISAGAVTFAGSIFLLVAALILTTYLQ